MAGPLACWLDLARRMTGSTTNLNMIPGFSDGLNVLAKAFARAKALPNLATIAS